jgi:hypothetical protein
MENVISNSRIGVDSTLQMNCCVLSSDVNAQLSRSTEEIQTEGLVSDSDEEAICLIVSSRGSPRIDVCPLRFSESVEHSHKDFHINLCRASHEIDYCKHDLCDL